MKLTVGQWGNSLALRIPKDLARDLRLAAGDELGARVVRGLLHLEPKRRRRTVEELTRGARPGKVGKKEIWGGPVGREVW
jgi:antitoxin MazE